MDPLEQVEKLKRRIAKLEHELYTDELTRILNRRGVMASLKPLVNAVHYQFNQPQKRKSFTIRALSVLFVDIDHFKSVNDTYGHPAGDEALKKVAQVLRSSVREIDLVGRWGGEEMIVGLVGANLEEAAEIAETLRSKIEKSPVAFGNKEIKLTASFGVAVLQKNMTIDELLSAADVALYQAKDTGRNKVVTA